MICNSEVIYILLLRHIFVHKLTPCLSWNLLVRCQKYLFYREVYFLSWLSENVTSISVHSWCVDIGYTYNRMEISFYSLFVLFCWFFSWCFTPISVCLLGWFRLFGIKQHCTGGVNLSISGFFWWIIGLKIICNGMQCEKFVSVPVVAVLLGTVHILRKHIFMHIGPPSPLRKHNFRSESKQKLNFFYPRPSLLRNIWMVPK